MKAIILNEPGSVDELHLEKMDKPHPLENEVLIKVKAISINPVDVKTRIGKGVYGRLKNEKPLILGWDISGLVEEVGSAVNQFKVGDAVFGMINFPGHGKAYAEYVTAPEDQIALKPPNISFEAAAASTLVALTAYQAMVHHAKIQPGQEVLVHAAAGGVGHIAVQLAKHLGAKVTGTSSAKNKDFILSLGADAHIDYQNHDWKTNKDAFDFVLDAVGGDNIENSILVTKKGGTLISIPTGLTEAVRGKAMEKGITASFMLVQSDGADMKAIANLLEKGTIKPFISQTFSFEEMKQAHLQQETGRTVGKLVIKI